MTDVFKELRVLAESAAERVRYPLKTRAEIDSVNARKERERGLREAAEEVRDLVTDRRYPVMKKFFETLKAGLNENLIKVCASSDTKDKQVLLAARLSAQIELIEGLQARPQRIIDELKDLDKESVIGA